MRIGPYFLLSEENIVSFSEYGYILAEIPIDKDLDPDFGGGTWRDGNGCTAFSSCGNGRIIRCDGRISCQSFPVGEVLCDGVITVSCY